MWKVSSMSLGQTPKNYYINVTWKKGQKKRWLNYLASRIGLMSVVNCVAWPNSSCNSKGMLKGTPTRKGSSKRPTENFSGLPSKRKEWYSFRRNYVCSLAFS